MSSMIFEVLPGLSVLCAAVLTEPSIAEVDKVVGLIHGEPYRAPASLGQAPEPKHDATATYSVRRKVPLRVSGASCSLTGTDSFLLLR